MKILYIWDADYPWDVRVAKICNALAEKGYEVHIAARNLQKRDEYEFADGLHIHRTRGLNSDRFNYFMSFPLFCSPIWKRLLDGIISKNCIDVIIVRDLPLAIAGIWAGKRAGIPVVLDMAEDYVAMIKDIWRLRKFQGINLVVRNPYFAKQVEKYVFKNIDHVLVVVDEAKDLVVKRGGIPRKVSIVSNTPQLCVFESSGSEESAQLELIRDSYSVIYTGGIQLGRGLQLVINAMPNIIKRIPDFKFVIVGDGYAAGEIKQLIKSVGVEDYIIWVGWVNHEQVYDYIRASKVGVIPHFVTEHVQTTIPNKIFDYMGCGIPVVASDSRPMKALLEKEKCGVSFNGGSAEDLERAMCSISGKEEELGRNGMSVVRTKYNWSHEEDRLVSALESLVIKVK